MCLFSRNTMPLKADKPVTCYKVFEEVYCSLDASCSAKMIITPYMGQVVTRDEFDGKKPMQPDIAPITKIHYPHVRKDNTQYIMIESGFIHAYQSKDAALTVMEEYFSHLSIMELIKHHGDTYFLCRFILCECEIPAGTEYYKGGDVSWRIETEECCGAEQIIIKKVIAEVKKGKVKIL